MYFRVELLTGGQVYDVTDDLVNWEDVELAFKREELDGVVRSFSTKFQFAGSAYSLLLGAYLEDYLGASASIVYYVRNNSWLWNEVFRCALDYSTFAYNATTCEINAVDNSLASLIKAKRGTQYEYAVSGMKEGKALYYDGLQMSAYCRWKWTGEEDEDGNMYVEYAYDSQGGTDQRGQVPVYITGSEFPFTNRMESYDGGTEKTDWGTDYRMTYDELMKYALFRSTSVGELTVHLKIDLHLNVEDTQGHTPDSNIVFFFSHLRRTEEGYEAVSDDSYRKSMPDGQETNLSYEKDITMKNEDFLAVWFYIGDHAKIYQSSSNAEQDIIEMTTTLRNNPQEIDVIKPSALLNRLLKSINSGNEGLTGVITSGVDTRLDNTLIVAAESARGLDNAKIYSSYTKFCNWMSAEFGFVPVVDDSTKTVTFVKRDSLFKDTETKDLGSDCTEFEFEVDSSMIYSRIRVGYDKVDYDSVNGRDEWRFTTSYTTGITLTDNSLDLISPYRADAYGIEFLAAKRGEETTDDESDTDVFMVGAALNSEGTQYELIRGGDYAVTGVISPDTMFNAMYTQRKMIEANERYLASFAGVMDYASSDGNSEVTVGGVSEDSDVTLEQSLFTVGKLSVETGDLEQPQDLAGYVSVTKNGREYQGYIESVSYSCGREQAVRYDLIVKSIE